MDAFNVISMLPLLVALLVVLTTSNAVFGLFIASFCGALALNGWNPTISFYWLIENGLYASMYHPYLGTALVFVVFYCGFVGCTENTGSITGLSEFLLSRAKGPKSLQFFAFLSGAIVFFSDLGAPMVVGHVFRPAFDEQRIPREKLAFLINSSAPPVCALVPIVGWGLVAMTDLTGPFEFYGVWAPAIEWRTFTASIVYFIFPFLMIASAFPLIFSSKRFSGLKVAEKRAACFGGFYAEGETSDEKPSSMGQRAGKARVFFLSTGVLCLSFAWQLAVLTPSAFTGVNIITAMCVSFVLGGAVLLAALKICGVMPFKEALGIYCKCFYTRTVTVTALMMTSWAFGLVCLKLGADKTLFNLLSIFPGFLMPSTVFTLSAALSYAIGSAWSTYGIAIPLAVSFACLSSSGVAPSMLLGAVISGAVLGDFSSPRSHSPSLAARSAWCDVRALLRVQRPYVLSAGLVSLTAFAVAVFVSGPILLAVSIIAYTVICLFVAQPS